MAEIKPPKVFISYAWEHDLKTWVLDFATRLRSDGINAILDQWETVPGDQLTQFMEKSVRDSDFVVFICTPTYKRKSDRRKGGVGYEGSIITGEVFSKNNHRKFIPVLRKGKWFSAAPSWATSKLFIDFRGEPYIEANYQQLLNTLFGKSPTAPPVRDNTLREGVEHEVADKAQRDRIEQDVAKRIVQIDWKSTDALHDGKPYISISITSRENRFINCYSYIKSLELNGVVRDDIKNEIVKHTTRVSWSGGSGDNGIKHIDPTGFGKLNLASLDTTDFIRSPLQFETAKGPQLKDSNGNLLPVGKYTIELGLACSAEGIDFPEIPIKIGFEYIEEYDYFEDDRIISGRETRKVLRLLKIEPSESVSGSTKPKEVITSEKDIKSRQEKRMFYDLTAHYEFDFENANAETLSNFLFESLTRIMRTVTGVDKNDNSRTAEYQTSQIEYLDPKDGKTTQHALIVHGKKVRYIGKGDIQGVEPLAVVSEMLIITVTQDVNFSRVRFDSNELPNDAFKNLIEWILADLGKSVTVQINDAIPEKLSPSKQGQLEIKTPEQQKGKPDNATRLEKARVEKEEIKKRRLPYFETPITRNNVTQRGNENSTNIASNLGEDTHLRESSVKPESGEQLSHQDKGTRPLKTEYIVAFIGAAATIIAAILGSPLIDKWFSPVAVATESATATITMTFQLVVPSQTIEPSQTPTILPTFTRTKTNTPTVTPTFTPIPTDSFLLQEDFEDNFANGWYFLYAPDSVVKRDPDGNHYLLATGLGKSNYYWLTYGDKYLKWTDYAFESRIKFVEGPRNLRVWVRGNGINANYSLLIYSGIYLFQEANPQTNEFTDLTSSTSRSFDQDRWYTIRVEIKGDIISLYIDNVYLGGTKFSIPPINKQGGIGFGFDGASVLNLDDIRVWSLR